QRRRRARGARGPRVSRPPARGDADGRATPRVPERRYPAVPTGARSRPHPARRLPGIGGHLLARSRAAAGRGGGLPARAAAARAWARRWVVAGPAEAEAHLMTARVLELDGSYEASLRELDIADSLGVEVEAEAVAARRMILLGKLGRLDDARRIADSLWGA